MIIPKERKENYEQLQQMLTLYYRQPNKDDSNKICLSCVVVDWYGTGYKKVYRGFRCCRVDFGTVTEKQAEFAYFQDGKVVMGKTPFKACRVFIRKELAK